MKNFRATLFLLVLLAVAFTAHLGRAQFNPGQPPTPGGPGGPAITYEPTEFYTNYVTNSGSVSGKITLTTNGGGGGSDQFNQGQFFTNGAGQIGSSPGFEGTNYNENGAITFPAGSEEIQDYQGSFLSLLAPNGTVESDAAVVGDKQGEFDGANFVGSSSLEAPTIYLDAGGSGIILFGNQGPETIQALDYGAVSILAPHQAIALTLDGTTPGDGLGGLSCASMTFGSQANVEYNQGGNTEIDLFSPGATVSVSVDKSNPGAGDGTINAAVFSIISDRNLKTNFVAADVDAALSNVARLPLTTWRFKTETNGSMHVGPMAQDFQSIFRLDSKTNRISLSDELGVALEAIQALDKKVAALEASQK